MKYHEVNYFEVEIISLSKSKKTLVVYLSKDIKIEIIFTYEDIARKRNSKLRSGFLRRNNKWLLIHKKVMKSLEYLLLVTMLTQDKLEIIKSPILSYGLPI